LFLVERRNLAALDHKSEEPERIVRMIRKRHGSVLARESTSPNEP
jgi:hypothetical protein